VLLLGGPQYLNTDPVIGANAVTIMRIFSVYGLLLPIDRMTGIGLDSINMPDKNFLKVLIMVIANVIGDLVAVFIFGSLEFVAVGSILFTLIGLFLGYYFIDRHLDLNFRQIIISGLEFYKSGFQKLRNR
jgi:O-antigen/teichoic acid export membrane protein